MAIHTFAAIYIGTYDVSLKVFEFTNRKKFHEVDHIRSRQELGKGAYGTGTIGYEQVEELCETLAQFKEIMESYKVDSYEVCAAAALRDTTNEIFVLDQIYLRTGFRVKVLSNSEHRFISYKAVAGSPVFEEMIKTSAAVVDVGGASVQITLFRNGKMITTQHMEAGIMRLRNLLGDRGYSLKMYENQIEEYVNKKLEGFRAMYMNTPVDYLILISDYADGLVKKIEEKGGKSRQVKLDKGDYYLLNGGKIFITNAPKADTYVVFAVTTPDIGTRGISAFIVEKGWKGFEFGDHYDKMGIRSSSTAELIFNDVKVPKENLLGKEGEGFKIAMSTLDGGRIGIAAQALGIAQGAFEHALSYSKERVQFGKPIAAQQSIAFKLADMATKLRCARFLIYSAAELKEQHAPYGMESAMAKMYASDIALEVTNDALQIHGGSGYLKGMEVERAYRDAKITTLYEGTNEIQRVVIASHLLGRLGKSSGGESRSAAKKPAPITGIRKKTIFREGDAAQQVADLVAALKKDGHDFSVGIPMDTPIPQAERVVSAGKGIGEKKNMKLVESLAKAAGAAIGSSRPVAETLKYLPLNRYVGMSGQKFTGNLYIACGISGASQHLKGIKDASTIVAINKNGNAPIFKNCDYGIVGDVEEILPLLTAALDSGEKLPAPPMVKMKRPTPPKPAPIGDRYVCSGCGYEYVPELGDEDGEIAPGTLFEQLPAEWVCPECAETKDQFVKA